MTDINFTFPLIVVDFEATSLTHQSYPIEVGLAIAPDGHLPIRSWSTLIGPDPAWDVASQWDPDAERLHGISRWDLRSGAAVSDVMAGLNELVGPIGHAWCDGGDYDRHWLATLSSAAGVQPSFELRDIKAGFGSDQLFTSRYRDVISRSVPPHRAGPDAERICAALASIMRQGANSAAVDKADRDQLDPAKWQRHTGEACPIEPKTEIMVQFRNGQEAGPAPASDWRWKLWSLGESDWDVVAWRPA